MDGKLQFTSHPQIIIRGLFTNAGFPQLAIKVKTKLSTHLGDSLAALEQFEIEKYTGTFLLRVYVIYLISI